MKLIDQIARESAWSSGITDDYSSGFSHFSEGIKPTDRLHSWPIGAESLKSPKHRDTLASCPPRPRHTTLFSPASCKFHTRIVHARARTSSTSFHTIIYRTKRSVSSGHVGWSWAHAFDSWWKLCVHQDANVSPQPSSFTSLTTSCPLPVHLTRDKCEHGG